MADTDNRDLWAEVERELGEAAEPAPAPAAPRRAAPARWPWVAGAAAAVATVAMIAGWAVSRLGREDPELLRLLPERERPSVRAAAISPDGARIVYADEEGLRTVDALGAPLARVPLPEGMLVEEIDWYADGGGWFFSARLTDGFAPALYALDAGGPAPRLLMEGARRPAVSPDGATLLFVLEESVGRSIWSMRLPGGKPAPFLQADGQDFSHPAWSPDGARVAFVQSGRDLLDASLAVADAAGRSGHTLTSVFDRRTAPAWSGDRVLFGRRDSAGAGLWALAVDPESGEPGDEERLAYLEGASYLAQIDAAPSGRVSLLAVNSRVDTYVGSLDSDSLRPEPITSGNADHWPVAWLAPDALLVNREVERQSSIYRHRLGGAEPEAIADGHAWALIPGGDVLYGTSDSRASRVMRVSAAEPAPIQMGELPVHATHDRAVFRCPREAGRGCVFGERRGDVLTLHAFDPTRESGKGRVLARVELTGRDYGWNLSPDGRRAAVVNGGRWVRLVRLDTGDVRKMHLAPSVYTHGVAWSGAGDALYVSGLVMHGNGGYALYRVDLRGRSRLLWRTHDRWFDDPVPSPDGTRIALAARTVEADVWLWGAPR